VVGRARVQASPASFSATTRAGRGTRVGCARRPPGFLFIVHAGQLVRLDVARPVVEALQGTQDTKALRIECRVHPQASKTEPFAVTLWLTDDDKRTPSRIAVTNRSEHIAAELIDTTAG
jgi:hypothetical protein